MGTSQIPGSHTPYEREIRTAGEDREVYCDKSQSSWHHGFGLI